jgi:hypothetical protein
MAEEKLVFKVELVDNNMRVTLGTKHEALLALGLRKVALFVDEEIIQSELSKQQSAIQIPDSVLKGIR